jgi:6-phosphogluconolactonase (cycloisomerase 2 family)
MKQFSDLIRSIGVYVRGAACIALVMLSASLSAREVTALAQDVTCPGGGAFLYAASGDAAYGFRIDPSGALLSVPGSPFVIDCCPTDLLAIASRPLAYLATGFPDRLWGFEIDPTSGTLSDLPGSPFPEVGLLPITLAVPPSGRFLYVGHNNSGDLSTYAIDSDGFLTLQGPPIPLPPGGVFGSGTLAADPQGRFLFAAPGGFLSAVLVYAIDPGTGALEPVAGSPFPGEPSSHRVAVTPSGRFLLITNESSNSISVYSILAGGAVELVQHVPAGQRPIGVAIDPSGRFVYVVNPFADAQLNGAVLAYRMDADTGMLTAVTGSSFPAGGRTSTLVVVDPSGRFAYVANQGIPAVEPGSISVLAIDSTTGALAPVPGSPFPAGRLPFALATWESPNGPVVPPVISGLSVDHAALWPPNHQLVDVTVSYSEAACGAVVNSLSVTSNEPVNGTGDGDTAPDWVVVDDHHLKLRAERAAGGSGRVYTITVTSTDSAGHSSSQSVVATVPYDQR